MRSLQPASITNGLAWVEDEFVAVGVRCVRLFHVLSPEKQMTTSFNWKIRVSHARAMVTNRTSEYIFFLRRNMEIRRTVHGNNDK